MWKITGTESLYCTGVRSSVVDEAGDMIHAFYFNNLQGHVNTNPYIKLKFLNLILLSNCLSV